MEFETGGFQRGEDGSRQGGGELGTEADAVVFRFLSGLVRQPLLLSRSGKGTGDDLAELWVWFHGRLGLEIFTGFR